MQTPIHNTTPHKSINFSGSRRLRSYDFINSPTFSIQERQTIRRHETINYGDKCYAVSRELSDTGKKTIVK